MYAVTAPRAGASGEACGGYCTSSVVISCRCREVETEMVVTLRWRRPSGRHCMHACRPARTIRAARRRAVPGRPGTSTLRHHSDRARAMNALSADRSVAAAGSESALNADRGIRSSHSSFFCSCPAASHAAWAWPRPPAHIARRCEPVPGVDQRSALVKMGKLPPRRTPSSRVVDIVGNAVAWATSVRLSVRRAPPPRRNRPVPHARPPALQLLLQHLHLARVGRMHLQQNAQPLSCDRGV